MLTYNDIADEAKLQEPTKSRFIAYMQKRWGDPKDEAIKCQVGYAMEWAQRFKGCIEYVVSDAVGQKVLEEIDKKEL